MQSLKDTLNPWGPGTSNEYAKGVAGLLGTAMQQPGVMAGALGGAYNTYGQGYGAMAGGMGQLANAQSQLAGQKLAAYGTAENARQMGVGQMGTAALAAYGNASNAAQSAWGMNQTGYMKALSDMMGANQYATSQYGVGRDNALAGLGNSYATAGTGFANARQGLGSSYGQLAGQGANAYGNLAGALGMAGSNLGSSANQAFGNLRGTAMNAMSGLGQAGAGAYGSIGSSANNAYGSLGSAASGAMGNIGSSTAMAAGNLGASANNAYGSMGSAFGNAMGGVNQAALQGMSNLGSAGQNTLGMLGTAGANMAGAFGNAATQVAQNATNYTRDMAKLGLARELGLGNLNVASQGAATLPYTAGAIGGGGGISMSGPDGQIASGYYGPNYYGESGGGEGFGGGSGGSGGSGGGSGFSGGAPSPIFMNPYENRPFYQNGPQFFDGGGMSALGGLSNQGFGYLGNTAASSLGAVQGGYGAMRGMAGSANARLAGLNAANNFAIDATTGLGQQALSQNARMGYGSVLDGLSNASQSVRDSSRYLADSVGRSVDQGYGAIGSQAGLGARDIADSTAAGYGYLRNVGDQGFGGIGSSLMGGFGGLDSQSNAIRNTEYDTFSGLGGIRDSLVNSPVLGSLNNNYSTALGTLTNAYNSSRNDPRLLLQDTLSGLGSLNALNLGASAQGMNQFYGNMRNADTVPFDQYRNAIQGGFSSVGRELSNTQGQMNQLWKESGVPGLIGGGDPRADMQRQLEQDIFNYRRAGWQAPTHQTQLLGDLRSGRF